MKKIILPLFTVFILAACTSPTTEPDNVRSLPDSSALPDPFESGNYVLEPAFADLSFEDPLFVTFLADNSAALVVERTGQIHLVKDGTTSLFLDLSQQVDASGQEEGLLGFALDPAFEENNRFYVNYTAQSQTFISRFTANDPSSEEVLLSFDQPYSNHNGGHLAFGPDDYLYIASGDGGSGGDPHYHAQNTDSLLGKILRIDVSGESGYTNPADNRNNEVYAFGLRNPWRFSFDRETGFLWAGDVGQNAREEVNIIESGNNYGWNIYEGSLEFDDERMMDGEWYSWPIWEYDHSHGRSITGGYVYRGTELPWLVGKYVYGDFVSGTIWALEVDGTTMIENHELMQTDLLISSFGEDPDGELYVVDFSGEIYRLSAE